MSRSLRTIAKFFSLDRDIVDCAAGDLGQFCIGIMPQHRQFGCSPICRPRERSDVQRIPANGNGCQAATQASSNDAVQVCAEQPIFGGCPRSFVGHGCLRRKILPRVRIRRRRWLQIPRVEIPTTTVCTRFYFDENRMQANRSRMKNPLATFGTVGQVRCWEESRAGRINCNSPAAKPYSCLDGF